MKDVASVMPTQPAAKRRVSLVVACYNEQDNLVPMWERVRQLFSGLSGYDYELIFVDNVSTDMSIGVYQKMCQEDASVHVVRMARNTGNSQASYLAGMRYASGDAVVLLDGDLQDPPEVISEFISKWEAGSEVVYGVRKQRRGSLARRVCYYLFYRIFKYFSYLNIPLDAGDFGLYDRRVVDIIAALPERDVYLRGLRAWVGFTQVGVEYVRHERASGFTSNSFFTNVYWAKKAIVNFSYRLLESITWIALGLAFMTGTAALVYLHSHFYYGAPEGFTTILLTMLILGTVQLSALAVLAEYVIRIFEEVKQRPVYLVREVLAQKPHDMNFIGEVHNNATQVSCDGRCGVYRSGNRTVSSP